VKAIPRLIDQGQGGESRDPGVGIEGVVNLATERFGVRTRDRAPMELAVRHARAVRQEIAERNRPRGRIGLVQRTIRMAQDAHLRELRRITRDGLVQREAAFVEQHQRGHGRDRLGQ